MGNAEAAAEGSTLGLWKFQECKSKKQSPTEIGLLSLNKGQTTPAGSEWNYGVSKANAQNLARRLTDMPSNLMTPTIFAENVKEIFESLDVCVAVHDEDWIKEKSMNSFLSVTKGSTEPAKFVELSYSRGDEKVRPIVLVGKGVTFDTGGISLKPSKAMDEMRGDMGGAATCVAALQCIANCRVKVNVKVLIPLCENMPSGSATKPGDIVKAANGKTICVNNTDAEGRLILADGLCYAAGFDPKMIMSVATLTGAMRVALGDGATGVFSTSDDLYKKLEQAGTYAGDRVWRFPFWKQYKTEITKQPGYDVNNIGKGVGGGSCTAAAFLKEFVPECVDYLHLDIAGVCGPATDIPYLHKGMTGRPTRTLIEFMRMHSK
ncbi:cytosol aminopeptidase-like [Photinus pyralis]|nr:cytosol aminopeptidase-like [Photinus pyralis]XP_031335115.1 cytosol aminopeptidase-like [Photinus pyralis]